MDMRHMEFLEQVAEADLARVRRKEARYQGSWKKRGGPGAFMMLARKWDRIENQVEDTVVEPINPHGTMTEAAQYDILQHVAIGGHPDGLLDDIRDLRCYLLLVEAELMAQGVVTRLEDAARAAD